MLALIVMAKDVLAVVISASVASDPVSRVDAVSVLDELDQISDTKVPIDVSVLVALVHTELAIVVVDTRVAPTIKDLSTFTKSPVGTLPQVICVGQRPCGPAAGTE